MLQNKWGRNFRILLVPLLICLIVFFLPYVFGKVWKKRMCKGVSHGYFPGFFVFVNQAIRIAITRHQQYQEISK
jgi:hypothetical protein